MCRVGNCCVYLDLEKGSFAIGITNLVIAVLQLLSNFGGLTILGIVTAALCIVINILLIIGSKQRKTIFVFIWLCVTIVFIVLSLLTLIMSLITLISNEHGMGALGGVIIFALTIALQIYFWIVVYSFYQELKESGAGVTIGSFAV